jgi:hypothetical protein
MAQHQVSIGYRWVSYPKNHPMSRHAASIYENYAPTNHVLFVYNPAGILAEHGGCNQALDVTYQTLFPGYF